MTVFINDQYINIKKQFEEEKQLQRKKMILAINKKSLKLKFKISQINLDFEEINEKNSWVR